MSGDKKFRYVGEEPGIQDKIESLGFIYDFCPPAAYQIHQDKLYVCMYKEMDKVKCPAYRTITLKENVKELCIPPNKSLNHTATCTTKARMYLDHQRNLLEERVDRLEKRLDENVRLYQERHRFDEERRIDQFNKREEEINQWLKALKDSKEELKIETLQLTTLFEVKGWAHTTVTVIPTEQPFTAAIIQGKARIPTSPILFEEIRERLMDGVPKWCLCYATKGEKYFMKFTV